MWQDQITKLISDWLKHTIMHEGKYFVSPLCKNELLLGGITAHNKYLYLASNLALSSDTMYFSWGLPRASGKSKYLDLLIKSFPTDTYHLSSVGKTSFLHFSTLNKLLIIIDEYPPTWEVLEEYSRGLSKDILIIKVETPKLA
jgi:hypothetical protein